LTERFEALRASEFARLAPSLPPAQREAVERFSQSLTRKFIHFPIEKLKSLRDGVGLGAPEIAFLKRLFLEPLPPAAEPEPDAERGPPEADGG
jgi:glutamyl-tRNA reductase